MSARARAERLVCAVCGKAIRKRDGWYVLGFWLPIQGGGEAEMDNQTICKRCIDGINAAAEGTQR